MSFLEDFLSILGGSIAITAATGRQPFVSAAILGLLLAAGCWWVCSHYSRLWNKKYRVKPLHHLLCGIAALVTLLATLVFVSLRNTLPAAKASVGMWEIQILADTQWANSTFMETYRKVQALGIEDFTNHPPPTGNGQGSIPTTQKRSQLEAALTYSGAAASHFRKNRPYLASMTKAETETPKELVQADMERHFQTNPNYPPQKAVALVAGRIEQGLQEQLPRVVKVLRAQFVALFLFFQVIPFALVGWTAYRELKVRT